MNPQALDDKYKDLTIREDEYFQNNVRSNQFMLKQNVQRLDFPVNKTRFKHFSIFFCEQCHWFKVRATLLGFKIWC